MMPEGKVTPRRRVWAWSLGLLLGAPGCTICPDPFDYSGPVPNGSAPQNDFRARSNGIAPTGGVPRPWPPVVQAFPKPTDEPRVAAPIAETTAAVEADTSDTAEDPEAVILTTTAESPDEPAAAPSAEGPAADEPSVDDILPPVPPARPASGSSLSETPGWRPRG